MKKLGFGIAALLFGIVFFRGTNLGLAQPTLPPSPVTGLFTDGPAIFRMRIQSTQALPGPAVSFREPSEDLPMEVRRGMLMFRLMANVTIITNFVREFDHYAPASLNNLVWTNFIANTNGKSMVIWSVRRRSLDWPARPVQVQWNHKSLIWGMKGVTAICPCWSGEGPPGWTPITALSRRHGYTRGHGMGPDRIGTDLAGQKVWFLTSENKWIERRIVRNVVRTAETSQRDYTLVLFSSDLPDAIEPMRVVHSNEIFVQSHCRYRYCVRAPNLLFKTEQGGNVSADIPGFTVNTMKGGDSASPNMLPLPGELVFWNGRTTSGPSPEMQADMDKLCRLEGIDPAKYQLQYVDLSKYPTY